MSEIGIDFFINFLVAIALGVLIGLEREFNLTLKKKESFAGIRTFTIVAILGALIGFLSQIYSYWIIVAGIISFSVMVVVFYLVECQVTKTFGATTEIASMAVFIIGILCAINQLRLAIITAIVVTLFLSIKGTLRGFVSKLSKEDIHSTLKFAIIAFMILPFLPNKEFGPFGVFNPYQIWLVVVLISAISLVGYLAMKFIGAKKGMGLTGFLGGFVSSTAVTMSMAQSSKTMSKVDNPFVFATVIASATMFFRVLVVTSILNNALISKLIIPMVVMGAVGLICAAFLWTKKDKISDKGKAVKFNSPFTIKPALKFAIFFIVVLFVAKIGLAYLGSKGMYITAILSGLADVDALTVSVSHLTKTGSLATAIGVNTIVIGVITNTLVKAGIANIFGSKEFRKKINIVFGLIILAGIISLLVM